jgi:hypothetical protein
MECKGPKSVSDKPLLLNSIGETICIDELIGTCRSNPERILADDEIGLVAYVGDLDVFAVSGLGHPIHGAPSPLPDGRWVQKVNEVSIVRFGKQIRRQIGSVVKTVDSDSIFVIMDGAGLRKVKAGDLKPGMILKSGEKVYL